MLAVPMQCTFLFLHLLLCLLTVFVNIFSKMLLSTFFPFFYGRLSIAEFCSHVPPPPFFFLQDFQYFIYNSDCNKLLLDPCGWWSFEKMVDREAGSMRSTSTLFPRSFESPPETQKRKKAPHFPIMYLPNHLKNY